MNIIVNSYNTLSAGTSNVTRFMLKSLSHHQARHPVYFFIPDIDLFADIPGDRGLKVYKVPIFRGHSKFIFRLFYDIFLLPVVSMILNASAVIVLANYSPMVVRGRKIVFLRHPFLVEDLDEKNHGLDRIIVEKLRNVIFKITLLTTDVVIVQTHFMKQAFLKKYGYLKRRVHVLPNPLSNLMEDGRAEPDNVGCRANNVLYVSRYAPHKQHMFLLRMADAYQNEFRRKGVQFWITVDPSKSLGGANDFLHEIGKRRLDDIIQNLGEVPNEQLSRYYRSAACLFFPSVSETFGNPLVEAMAFALPIIVPDLDYAKSICGEAGLYYKSDNTAEAYEKIMAILEDRKLREIYSHRSRLRLQHIPTVEQWIDEIFSLAEQPAKTKISNFTDA
jgi:glycosyltransferase involved in cell wall biosynthesis